MQIYANMAGAMWQPNIWVWIEGQTLHGAAIARLLVLSPPDHGTQIWREHRSGSTSKGFPATIKEVHRGMYDIVVTLSLLGSWVRTCTMASAPAAGPLLFQFFVFFEVRPDQCSRQIWVRARSHFRVRARSQCVQEIHPKGCAYMHRVLFRTELESFPGTNPTNSYVG